MREILGRCFSHLFSVKLLVRTVVQGLTVWVWCGYDSLSSDRQCSFGLDYKPLTEKWARAVSPEVSSREERSTSESIKRWNGGSLSTRAHQEYKCAVQWTLNLWLIIAIKIRDSNPWPPRNRCGQCSTNWAIKYNKLCYWVPFPRSYSSLGFHFILFIITLKLHYLVDGRFWFFKGRFRLEWISNVISGLYW